MYKRINYNNIMWETFSSLLDSLVSNIDDFFVIILIAAFGNKCALILDRFLRKALKINTLTCQAIKMSLQIFIFATCVIQLIGGEVVSSATGGIAIGVGYAFQPYIISLFNGLMIHNDDLINAEKWITIKNMNIIGAKVKSIGLFNSELIDQHGNQILLSNSMLSRSAVFVMGDDPWKNGKSPTKCSNWTKGAAVDTEGGHHGKAFHYLQHIQAES